ncbi:DUF4861 family protein [Hymenobacter terricola]|uniref:DUF4861 family protein n=1 Tax=Hymenobacter terricola TaxID=2819236 RepID=UPI001B30B76A|nr:DUF4861 family protein [Hymenobacter terricola]
MSSLFKSSGQLLFFIATTATSRAQGPPTPGRIVLRNTQQAARASEIISIARSRFQRVAAGYFPLVKKGAKTYVTQLIDTDADGQWDELLLEASLGANARDTLRLAWVGAARQPAFEQLTNVRFSRKTRTSQPEAEIAFLERPRGFTQNIADPVYQLEGPGIENDKVAFRAFFDQRNGKDVYGKIRPAPVLEQVGVIGSWHTLQPWGMDILHTGSSLGAGALAVRDAHGLHRLADADKTTFQALYEGPLRAAFALRFTNRDGAGASQNGRETIALEKGNYYYANRITLNLTERQQLVSGLANFDTLRVVYQNHNAQLSSISTYGGQAEGDKAKLGLAILFPARQYAAYATTRATAAIPNTSYVALKPEKSGAYTVWFFACWEKTDARFSTQAGFAAYVQQAADQLANPITATVVYPNSK